MNLKEKQYVNKLADLHNWLVSSCGQAEGLEVGNHTATNALFIGTVPIATPWMSYLRCAHCYSDNCLSVLCPLLLHELFIHAAPIVTPWTVLCHSVNCLYVACSNTKYTQVSQ